MVKQGEIINVTGLSFPVLVLSNNEYNKSGHVQVCPISKEDSKSLFSNPISVASYNGYANVDDIKTLDIASRGYSSRGQISIKTLILILGIVQSIFDYT